MMKWKERIRKRFVSAAKKHTVLRMPILAVTLLFLVVYHGVKEFFTGFSRRPMRQRITVGILVVAFLTVQIGGGFVFADRGEPEDITVLSFSQLEEDILSQHMETGGGEADIVLPGKLKAKVRIGKEETGEEEKTAATGGSIQKAEEKEEKDSIETISLNVTWKLVEAETRAGEKKKEFDGNAAGTYRYCAVLPEEYKIAGDCEIPIITVTVKEPAESEKEEEKAKEGEKEGYDENETVKKTASAIKGSARTADSAEENPDDTDEETLPGEVGADEPGQSTVTYDYAENGGTSAEKESVSVPEGEKADLTVSATKVGWTFVGWNTDADATQGLEEVEVGAEDITLYAIYKKTLEANFYSGNSRMTSVEVTIYNDSESGTVTAPALDSRTGETAVGYTSRSAETAVQKNPEVRAGESVTLNVADSPCDYYGIYEKSVTISYNSNGGGAAPAAETDKAYTNIGVGEAHAYPKFTLKNAPERKGYTFSGWRMGDISGNSYDAGDELNLETDTTFYADWSDSIAPVFGEVSYNDGYVSFWNWIIRKSNLILTVPVTEEGSGLSTVSYTLTPDRQSEAVRRGTLDIGASVDGTADDGLVSAVTEDGRTEITVTLTSDFKGKISLSCEDIAGNASSKIIGAGSGGVIVEDNAPTITLLAGSGSSLTDWNEGAVNVSVQVTDDGAERVSGGIREITYAVTNSGSIVTRGTLSDPDFSEDMVTDCGFSVRINTEGENNLRVTATDNAGNVSTRQQIIKVLSAEPETGNVEMDTYQGTNSPATQITTSQAELIDLVLNNEDKEAVNNGSDIKILLSVEDATGSVSAAERSITEDNLGNYLMGQYLDISLFKVLSVDYRVQITELGRPIRIQITVPDRLKKPADKKSRTYAVMRIHDGEAELLPDIDNQENTVTIETSLFSTYVLVYRDTENTTEGPDEPIVTQRPDATEGPDSTFTPNVTEGPDSTFTPDVTDEPGSTFMPGESDGTENTFMGESDDTVKLGERNDGKNQGPDTGDSFPLLPYASLAAAAAILFLVLCYKRKDV